MESIVGGLIRSRIVGRSNGRAEFDPRNLGNRSLQCDAQRNTAKENMNANVKGKQLGQCQTVSNDT